MVTVRRCKVADIEAAPDVVSAYEAESGTAEFGKYCPNWPQYKAMEESGWFTAIGAFRGDRLVGMITLLHGPNPHIGAVIASTESFFVMPDERKDGWGLVLLAHAEEIAREKGAHAIFVSARVGTKLAKLMRLKRGYNLANEVSCKVLK